MKPGPKFCAFILVITALTQIAMSRTPQYDEEAREAERAAKRQNQEAKAAGKNPVKQFAGGVKQATVDSTAGLLEQTVESTREDAPVIGTLEGARKGTEKVLDSTVKGVAKVATFGYGDVQHYEVEEPKANSGDPTKIKIKI